MRECRKCGETKDLEQFYGCRKVCKSCFTTTYNKYNCPKCGELINKNSQQCVNCKKIKLEKEGKKCCKCNKTKPITEFSKIKKGSKLLRSNCKSCEVENSKKYRLANPERVREQNKEWAKKNPDSVKKSCIRTKLRKWNYNGDLEKKTEEIFQADKCECCGNSFKDSKDKHMDHCHENNKYRGVLCYRCNVTLGHLKDSKKRLKQLLDYLD